MNINSDLIYIAFSYRFCLHIESLHATTIYCNKSICSLIQLLFPSQVHVAKVGSSLEMH